MNKNMDGFMEHNNIQLEYVDEKHASVSCKLTKDSLNPYGMMHGGLAFALADTSAGHLVHYHGGSYVTLDGSLNYISNRGEGKVFAKSTLIHQGGTTSVVEVHIVDESDHLLCAGRFTMFKIKKG